MRYTSVNILIKMYFDIWTWQEMFWGNSLDMHLHWVILLSGLWYSALVNILWKWAFSKISEAVSIYFLVSMYFFSLYYKVTAQVCFVTFYISLLPFPVKLQSYLDRLDILTFLVWHKWSSLLKKMLHFLKYSTEISSQFECLYCIVWYIVFLNMSLLV